MIIDGGIYANVASDTLVKKLNLICIKHNRPYRLQWLNEYGEVKVTKKVSIVFEIGKYSNKVMCDIGSIQVSHLLLWCLDRDAIYDGFINKFTIVKYSKTITFVPLSLK